MSFTSNKMSFLHTRPQSTQVFSIQFVQSLVQDMGASLDHDSLFSDGTDSMVNEDQGYLCENLEKNDVDGEENASEIMEIRV